MSWTVMGRRNNHHYCIIALLHDHYYYIFASSKGDGLVLSESNMVDYMKVIEAWQDEKKLWEAIVHLQFLFVIIGPN